MWTAFLCLSENDPFVRPCKYGGEAPRSTPGGGENRVIRNQFDSTRCHDDDDISGTFFFCSNNCDG